jgi:hypothetical protein
MNDARFIKRKFMPRIFFGFQVLMLTACAHCRAGAASETLDLTELSLEKLMEMQISKLDGDNTHSTPPSTNSATPPKDIRRPAPQLRGRSNPNNHELFRANHLTIPVHPIMMKAARNPDERMQGSPC